MADHILPASEELQERAGKGSRSCCRCISATAAQRIVDTYAVQHATNLDRRNRQSVAGHLMSLCASIEHGISGAWLQTMIGDWTHRDYLQLAPGPPDTR